MPGEQKHASAWIESDAEDGKIQLIGCDTAANDGKPCPVWTPVWLQTKIH